MNLDGDLRRALGQLANSTGAKPPPASTIRERADRQRTTRVAASVATLVFLVVVIGSVVLRGGGGGGTVDSAGSATSRGGSGLPSITAPHATSTEIRTTDAPQEPHETSGTDDANSTTTTLGGATVTKATPTSSTSVRPQPTSSPANTSTVPVGDPTVPTTASGSPTTTTAFGWPCPVAKSGHWAGQWTSSAIPDFSGTLEADLFVTSTTVTGTMRITGSPIFTTDVQVVGTVECARIDFGGGFVGALNASGTAALGQYSVMGADFGTWNATVRY